MAASKELNDIAGEPPPPNVDRRNFLRAIGTGAAAGAVLPLVGAGAMAAQPMQMPSGTAANAAPAGAPAAAEGTGAIPGQTYLFLNTDEGDFVEAAVDTLIPSDPVGPGALESGVANFIDQQLAGGYGMGARLYIQGPFPDGAAPEQGYQLPMTPSQLMRAGMLDVRGYCAKQYNQTFASLSPAERARVLSGLEAGEIALATIPAKVFFDELIQLTINGYFADPMYGGNRNGGAWAMIGFPGPNAMYHDKIAEYRNKLYKQQPLGIDQLVG